MTNAAKGLVERIDELRNASIPMGSDARHVEDFQEELGRNWESIRRVLVAAKAVTSRGEDAADIKNDDLRKLNEALEGLEK